MRLLVVNWLDRTNPRSGGAEIHLHEVFGRLARRGHEVTVLCSGWRGLESRETVDDLDVHRVGGRHTFLLRAGPYARSRLRRPWDAVIEDLNKVPLFTPGWGLGPVVPLVHHLFGATAFQEAAWPVAALTWLLERPIPRVYRGLPTIAVSESTKSDLVHRGLVADDIEVVPNGVDPDLLGAGLASERYPEPSLLYLGRLQRYKRVDLVIEAVARLVAEGSSVRLRVAGRGEDQERLRGLAARLGVADRVEFLGWVDETTKRALLGRSWVHVLTSPKEGWGIVNLEAAARGTPTVASDAPGLRDSVVDGRTGFLVPHGDVGALAARLGSLLGDAELRRRMGDEARRFASGFTWEAAADGVERFLLERVAPTSPRT